MRKTLITLFILFIFASVSFADEYLISKISCFSADNLYDRELSFKYDDEDDVFYFFRSTYSRSYWFELTPAQVEQLRAGLAKINAWIKLARDNKSEVAKEVPNSEIRVKGTMRSGNDWYTTKRPIPLRLIFSSGEEAKIVSFLIYGGESESRQNQFIDIEFEPVIFFNSQIDDFINAISLETIEKAKEKHQAEKNTADMFQ